MPPEKQLPHNHSWWRAYFIDHPGLRARQPEASVGSGASQKAKVYCEKCYFADLATLKLSDEEDVCSNRRAHCRMEEELKDYLWTTDKVADRGWCRAASSTLLAHL
ncbi:hypothetical protein PAXINDRAFT_19388 [Paxillus involutus ATCC 200175]|uniref:Uncharacterized protein n=1 Tax=Paxillus involutus ATCC 200175 TaxID=664439 RepID=A0A0C9SWX9_PAXIN|nr:hypothetical protein PAXINDRAFT_19388 [Paxillus involutus ATCC 200175]